MTKQQEVEKQCMTAAGFKDGKWPQREGSFGRQFDNPGPVQIKMHHGELVTTGWENAARAILQGFATLVGPAA